MFKINNSQEMNLITEQEQMHVFTSFPATAQDEDTAQVFLSVLYQPFVNQKFYFENLEAFRKR